MDTECVYATQESIIIIIIIHTSTHYIIVLQYKYIVAGYENMNRYDDVQCSSKHWHLFDLLHRWPGQPARARHRDMLIEDSLSLNIY